MARTVSINTSLEEYAEARKGIQKKPVHAKDVAKEEANDAVTEENIDVLKEKAERGSARHQTTLGYCYERGSMGLSVDVKRACHWYTLAARQGYGRAMYNLGLCHVKGVGVEQDPFAAMGWFEAGSKAGFAKASLCAGMCARLGHGVVGGPNMEAAFRCFRQAAEAGEPEAMHCLGECLDAGDGCEEDPEKARIWYEAAARRGHAGAMYALGCMFLTGAPPVPANPSLAFEYLQSAVNRTGRSNGRALNNLGYCFGQGLGTARDPAQAASLYAEAANLGDADGMHNFGAALDRGCGCPMDKVAAAVWWGAAAKADHPKSLYYYSRCVGDAARAEKHGLAYDPDFSYKLLRRSADKGYKRAMDSLRHEEEKNGTSPR